MPIIDEIMDCLLVLLYRFGRKVMSRWEDPRLILTTLWILVFASGFPHLAYVSAQDLQGKEDFTLFNRTPEKLLREMEADRPDITESPRTVDAGWSQIEMSFIEWGKDGRGDELLRIPSANFKLGVTSTSDLQIIVNGWDRTRTRVDRGVGIGDRSDHGTNPATKNSSTPKPNGIREDLASSYIQETRLRWKRNLIGNDPHSIDTYNNDPADCLCGKDWPADLRDDFSQRFALGIISTLLIPAGPGSSASNQPEFGVSFPWSYELSAAYELMGQTEFQLPNKEGSSGYGCDYLQTIGLGYPVYGAISGYYEQVFIGSLVDSSEENSAAQFISSFGFVYEVSPNFNLDLGVQLGLNSAAKDHLLFSGMTTRF